MSNINIDVDSNQDNKTDSGNNIHENNNNKNNNKRKWQEKTEKAGRPGDWICLKCGINNWANRDKCFKCKKSKVAKEPRQDWTCELCEGVNVPNRFSCFRCGLYKKDPEWESKRNPEHAITPLFVHPGCMPYTDSSTGDVSIYHPASLHSRCGVNRPPPKIASVLKVDPIDEIYARAFAVALSAETKTSSSSSDSSSTPSSSFEYPISPPYGDEWPRLPSVVERYYTEMFYVANKCEQYVHKHSNGLCLVGLASGHPALSPGKNITVVNWNVGNSDRSAIEVSGRKKKGALWLDAHSPLCNITCSDGSVYNIQTGVHGKLIEVNSRLPAILTPATSEGDGWLAIIMLKKVDHEALSEKLLSKQGYQVYRQSLLRGLAEHTTAQTPTMADD